MKQNSLDLIPNPLSLLIISLSAFAFSPSGGFSRMATTSSNRLHLPGETWQKAAVKSLTRVQNRPGVLQKYKILR